MVFCFNACGENSGNGITESFSTDAATSTETVKETKAQTSEETTNPEPSPMDNSTKPLKAVYGKRTGTNKTYTGLEPLSEIQLPVVDPENVRGLSENQIQHSFGVSKNGEPHEISVNNQKFYADYGAMCLDTSGEKVIYLTFDCGYENGCTEKILDTL